MAKRTVSIGDVIETVDWESLWRKLQPRGRDYVSELCEYSPMAALVWEEAHKIIRDSDLTGYQAAVFKLWLQGWTPTAIGYMFPNPDTGQPRRRSTIEECIDAVLAKVSRLPHLGALTAMIESQGWQPIREYLADARSAGMPLFQDLPDNEKIGYCAMVTGQYTLLSMNRKQRRKFLQSVTKHDAEHDTLHKSSV